MTINNFTNYYKMIKSRFNTAASWIIILGCCLFGCSVLIFLFSYYTKINPFNFTYKNNRQFAWWIFAGLFGFILFFIIGYLQIKIILIDNKGQRIIIKNLIGQHAGFYNYLELDGYCDMVTSHDKNITSYRAIGLVKNGNIIFTIDSYYYSNVDEMRKGLNQLKYLGVQKNSP